MKQLIAAGGVLYRNRDEKLEIIMIKRNGVWDLPKGKLEEDESISECALREVAEEIGLNDLPILEGKIGVSIHTYSEKGEQIEKTTYWYRMKSNEVSDSFIPQIEEGVTEVIWYSLDEAKKIVGYDNLLSIIREFEYSF